MESYILLPEQLCLQFIHSAYVYLESFIHFIYVLYHSCSSHGMFFANWTNTESVDALAAFVNFDLF